MDRELVASSPNFLSRDKIWEQIIEAQVPSHTVKHLRSQVIIFCLQSRICYNLNNLLLLVIRFTREQLIALRKDSKILGSMGQMSDIVCYSQQNPVCFSRLEPEDVSFSINYTSTALI